MYGVSLCVAVLECRFFGTPQLRSSGVGCRSLQNEGAGRGRSLSTQKGPPGARTVRGSIAYTSRTRKEPTETRNKLGEPRTDIHRNPPRQVEVGYLQGVVDVFQCWCVDHWEGWRVELGGRSSDAPQRGEPGRTGYFPHRKGPPPHGPVATRREAKRNA